MKHTFKSIKNNPIRTVKLGAGWHIDYTPADGDYAAIIDGSVGCIGYEKSLSAAMDLINDYAMDQAEQHAEWMAA